MDNERIREQWRRAGGDFFGPHVEHGSMEEAKLLPYLGGLYGEIEGLRAVVRHESDCVEAAQAEIERLRAALVPFAKIGLDVLENHPGWAQPAFTAQWAGYEITYAQFEAATAAVIALIAARDEQLEKGST